MLPPTGCRGLDSKNSSAGRRVLPCLSSSIDLAYASHTAQTTRRKRSRLLSVRLRIKCAYLWPPRPINSPAGACRLSGSSPSTSKATLAFPSAIMPLCLTHNHNPQREQEPGHHARAQQPVAHFSGGRCWYCPPTLINLRCPEVALGHSHWQGTGGGDRMPSKCHTAGCTKRSHYGVAGSTTVEFCSEHKKDGMVNVVNKRCAHAGCTKQPTFGVAGSKKTEFCSQHKKDGMVGRVRKRCAYTGCTSRPCFGFVGTKSGKFCSEHKKGGMVDVASNWCGHAGCSKHPHYGVAGTKKAEFCAEHKRDGMVNVKSKRCGHPRCTKQPNFGIAGSKKVEFCSEHKRDGMVDVMSKRCVHPGCTKRPTYCVAGSNKREFCFEHKKDGMVNVFTRRCSHPGCTKFASYGVAGSKMEFCFEHKRDGMINLKLRRSKSRSTSDCRGGGGGRGRGSAADGGDVGAGQKRRGLPPSSLHLHSSTDRGRGGSKRTRQSPTGMSVDPPAVEPIRGEAPTPAEPDGATAVKMEAGLFEGRPSGSFQSRLSRRCGGR